MNEIPEDDIEKVALVDLSEETKKGFLSKLIWVVIIIIILGGGFAIWKFVLNKSGDGIVDVEETKKAPPREPPPFGEIYMINDVIINPMSGRRHFIVSIGLEVHDKNKINEIKKREILLRDNLITLFSSQPVDVLADIRYRQAFRSRVKKVMDYQLGEGVVSRVFFDKWVFQ